MRLLVVLLSLLRLAPRASATPPCDPASGRGACADPLGYGMVYSLSAASMISLTAVSLDTAVRAGRGHPSTRRDGITEIANMLPVIVFGALQVGFGAAPRATSLALDRDRDPALLALGAGQLAWGIGLLAHGAWATRHAKE